MYSRLRRVRLTEDNMQENRHQIVTKNNTPAITLRTVIADAFEKSGLTDKALSKALSVHPRTVSRILTEDGLFIDTPTLKRVADTLGLDYDALAALRPPSPKSPKLISTSAEGFDDDEKKLMAEFISKQHDNG